MYLCDICRRLLLGEISATTGVMEEVIEAFASILEVPGTIEEMEAATPLSETISIGKEKEPPVVASGAMSVEEERPRL